MLRAKTHATLCLTITALTFAGCGGSSSSGVSAASYVKSVCTAIVPFAKDVQARTSALNVSSITNLTQGKHALEGFIGAAAGDADSAVSAMKAAGTPNVNNGSKIAAGLVSAFTQLKATFATAQSQVRALSTTSVQAFKSSAGTVVKTIQSSIGGIGASLGPLESAELDKAAKSTPACASLGS